jgi:hypothetical protein
MQIFKLTQISFRIQLELLTHIQLSRHTFEPRLFCSSSIVSFAF